MVRGPDLAHYPTVYRKMSHPQSDVILDISTVLGEQRTLQEASDNEALPGLVVVMAIASGQWSGCGTAITVSPSMSEKSRGLQVWIGRSLEIAVAAIMAS